MSSAVGLCVRRLEITHAHQAWSSCVSSMYLVFCLISNCQQTTNDVRLFQNLKEVVMVMTDLTLRLEVLHNAVVEIFPCTDTATGVLQLFH